MPFGAPAASSADHRNLPMKNPGTALSHRECPAPFLRSSASEHLSAKAEVRFGQEIIGACCRIQAYDGRELMLECIELVPLRFRLRDLTDVLKLRFQIIEEQRVNDLVNVLDGCVVHATGAARFRIQRRLKYGAEDGRADVLPVEALRRSLQNQRPDLSIELRYLDRLVRKKAASRRPELTSKSVVYIICYYSGRTN